MRSFLIFFLFLSIAFSNPLDDYVNLDDGYFKWELSNTVDKGEYFLYVLKLTSQKWLSEREIDKPVWQHWVKVIVPKGITSNKRNGLIYINGGGNPLGAPPSDIEDFLPPIALDLNDIVAELDQIPNQPITFAGESFSRTEDALLAKSWDLFFETKDPIQIARVAMVKSVVKAMDAIQQFVSTLQGIPVPQNFLLAGGSKRGWTTWLAGAVDKRVVGIAPLVIDVLDMNPNFNEIYQTYGRWPIALKDYTQQNVTRCLNCQSFDLLAQIEDPKYYLDRFIQRNVPIFALNANGDEFFIPTGWKFWYPGYKGEKYLRYVPNAEHSLATAIRRVVNSISSFAYTIDENISRPKFEWSLNEDKSIITLISETKPKKVKLWEAYNKRGRAFILNCYLTCWWTSTDLDTVGNGTYVGRVEIPQEGYKAFMLEVEYDLGWKKNYVISTGVSIVPDTFDNEPCPDSKCAICSTC